MIAAEAAIERPLTVPFAALRIIYTFLEDSYNIYVVWSPN
jgi:hypothetical protein